MFVIGYAMLEDRPELPRTRRGLFEQINDDQLQRYVVKRLERLGLTVSVTPAA
jgi:hypothetical protein